MILGLPDPHPDPLVKKSVERTEMIAKLDFITKKFLVEDLIFIFKHMFTIWKVLNLIY
jgi:hypothetical protein